MKTIFSIFFVLALATSSFAMEVPWEIQDQADEYGEMGFDFLRDGDFDKGLKLLNLATQTNPYDPKWHMHYSKVLAKRAIANMQAGNRRQSKREFKVVERELLMATKLFLDRGQKENAAHTYHQIAEINKNIFRKRRLATAYYQKALELNPNHPGVKAALGIG